VSAETVFFLVINLLGGLAIFLLGLEHLADGAQAVAGSKLRDVLARLTRSRVSAAATGAVATAIVNSSSVATVLVVGFVTANMMTLTQAVSVVMGANIGTTVTAQIVAFHITDYAPLPVAIGFFLSMFARSRRLKNIGFLIMGLGLIFLGMHLMSAAMDPLRTWEPFQAFMVQLANPLLGMAVGALFTALVQSSSATTGIVIVFASQGLMTLEAGIALALGANIGTSATALLATIGKNRNALQAALAHTLFNVLGALLWVAFLPQLADMARWTTARMGGPDLSRDIANAQTIFNIANTVVMLPFAGQFAKFIARLVPPEPHVSGLKFLTPEVIRTPSLALQHARMELARLGHLTFTHFFTPSDTPESARTSDALREMHALLSQIDNDGLSDDDNALLLHLVNSGAQLDALYDLSQETESWDGEKMDPHSALAEFEQVTVSDLELAFQALGNGDVDAAGDVLAHEQELDQFAVRRAGEQALRAGRPIAEIAAEIRHVERLTRIRAIAEQIADGEVALSAA